MLQENLNASKPSEHPPKQRGNFSKRLVGGNIGCVEKKIGMYYFAYRQTVCEQFPFLHIAPNILAHHPRLSIPYIVGVVIQIPLETISFEQYDASCLKNIINKSSHH